MHRRATRSQSREDTSVRRTRHGGGLSIAAFAGVAAVSLFLLTGCGGSASPYAIPTEILLGVLTALKTQKRLQFGFGEELQPGEVQKLDDPIKEDRHKGWFIFRRAELIGKRHTNFGKDQLIPLVSAQFDQVAQYLDGKLSPGGIFSDFAEPNGSSSAPPDQPFTWDSSHHFDLKNLAVQLLNVASHGKENDFLRERQMAVRTIVWHAAGLHEELWSQGGDGATLNQRALDEIVDRRLRSIERMRYQINGDGNTNRSAGGGRGPWVDDSRVRVYEYPTFAANLINPADVGHIWTTPNGGIVDYVDRDHAGLVTRFDEEPSSPSPNWLPAIFQTGVSQYVRIPAAPPVSLAAAIEALFQPKINIWERAWLFCDHSIVTAHLDALNFALVRQGQGSAFEGLVRPKFPLLGGIFGDLTFDAKGNASAVDDNSLFSDGVSSGSGDPGVFDGVCINYRDLQVGDHVILWNHHVYVSVTNGAWRLENAFVMSLDNVTDGFENEDDVKPAVFMKSSPGGTTFAGFGATGNHQHFLEALLDDITKGVAALFRTLPSVTGDAFIFEPSYAKAVVLKWTPYPGLVGDAWFIFLQRVTPGDRQSQYVDVPMMKKFIAHAVLDDPDPGSGYRPRPKKVTFNANTPQQFEIDLNDGVLFPLYVPLINGRERSWDEYFEKRRDDASLDVSLTPIRIGTEMVPALFVRGEDTPIQTIRPRVRP